MVKRGKPEGGSKAGRAKFAAAVDSSMRQSGAAQVRRRVEAQRTRLARAAQRAHGAPAAQLAVHIDGAEALAEHALRGDELATSLRLAHLRAVHAALVRSGADGAAMPSAQRDTALALQAPFVLALLDEGDAAEARCALDALDRAGLPLPTRDQTALAYSRALVEFVDGTTSDAPAEQDGVERSGPEDVPMGESAGRDGMRVRTAASAAATAAGAAVRAADAALAANPYVGVFLSHLDLFARLIDPETAAAALGAVPVEARAGRAAGAQRASDAPRDVRAGGGGTGGGSGAAETGGEGCKGAAEGRQGGEGVESEAHGPLEGSVEEALSYVAVGISPWLDFIGCGVEQLFRERLDAQCAGMEWPPRRCSAGGARFQAAFVHAAALAAEAGAEAEALGEEDGSDSEDGDGSGTSS